MTATEFVYEAPFWWFVGTFVVAAFVVGLLVGSLYSLDRRLGALVNDDPVVFLDSCNRAAERLAPGFRP